MCCLRSDSHSNKQRCANVVYVFFFFYLVNDTTVAPAFAVDWILYAFPTLSVGGGPLQELLPGHFFEVPDLPFSWGTRGGSQGAGTQTKNQIVRKKYGSYPTSNRLSSAVLGLG